MSNTSGKSQFLALYSPKRVNNPEIPIPREKPSNLKVQNPYKSAKSPSIPTDIARQISTVLSKKKQSNSSSTYNDGEKPQNKTLDYRSHNDIDPPLLYKKALSPVSTPIRQEGKKDELMSKLKKHFQTGNSGTKVGVESEKAAAGLLLLKNAEKTLQLKGLLSSLEYNSQILKQQNDLDLEDNLEMVKEKPYLGHCRNIYGTPVERKSNKSNISGCEEGKDDERRLSSGVPFFPSKNKPQSSTEKGKNYFGANDIEEKLLAASSISGIYKTADKIKKTLGLESTPGRKQKSMIEGGDKNKAHSEDVKNKFLRFLKKNEGILGTQFKKEEIRFDSAKKNLFGDLSHESTNIQKDNNRLISGVPGLHIEELQNSNYSGKHADDRYSSRNKNLSREAALVSPKGKVTKKTPVAQNTNTNIQKRRKHHGNHSINARNDEDKSLSNKKSASGKKIVPSGSKEEKLIERPVFTVGNMDGLEAMPNLNEFQFHSNKAPNRRSVLTTETEPSNTFGKIQLTPSSKGNRTTPSSQKQEGRKFISHTSGREKDTAMLIDSPSGKQASLKMGKNKTIYNQLRNKLIEGEDQATGDAFPKERVKFDLLKSIMEGSKSTNQHTIAQTTLLNSTSNTQQNSVICAPPTNNTFNTQIKSTILDYDDSKVYSFGGGIKDEFIKRQEKDSKENSVGRNDSKSPSGLTADKFMEQRLNLNLKSNSLPSTNPDPVSQGANNYKNKQWKIMEIMKNRQSNEKTANNCACLKNSIDFKIDFDEDYIKMKNIVEKTKKVMEGYKTREFLLKNRVFELEGILEYLLEELKNRDAH